MPIVDTTSIPLNITRYLLILLLCGTCMLLTVISLRINGAPDFPTALIYLKNTLAISAFVLLALAAVMIIAVMLRRSGGLTISEEGVTDNSNIAITGLIRWNEIAGVETRKVFHSTFLAIKLNNPEAFITRQNNPIKRLLLRQNIVRFGTPVFISASNIKADPYELLDLLTVKSPGKRLL
ncbi:STM3941 family protein [Chitinophaga rhizophila]|uniref:PH domain-containing protein n=1 Tax=Chitinophaga rhizophila TaxID=2866212 RepID=A0ABS7GIF7_9BACT|nr:STM3941 family protein [Chitinophaga rhizophila]MBW8687106.1 hypothetical protein [Chitinophaga rhizophila]